MSTWFEDIEVGAVTELGSHTFLAPEIKAFAKKYDPQPFHLDEEAAKMQLLRSAKTAAEVKAALSGHAYAADKGKERQ